MRMLLTSNGIPNDVTREALQGLLGTPLAESRIVVVLDAIVPHGGDKSMLLTNLESIRALGWADDEPEVFEVADVGPAVGLFEWFVICHLGASPEVVSSGHWLRFDAAGTLVGSA